MPANGAARRRHHRHRRRLALRRRPRALLGPRQRAACSGTRAITQFDVSAYPCQVAAWVPPVSIDDAPPLDGRRRCTTARADPKRYSRAALFGVIAAREAWRDAGLRAGEPGAGVLIGSGGGGIDVGEKQYQDFFTTGGRHVTPYAIAVGICGMVSSEISISLGLRGMSHVLSCGCTSSTDAIGYAASLIRVGRGRRAAVGRHRRLRAAGNDLRLLADARRLDALQRPAGGGVAAVRPRPRRLRARRGRVDARARARGSRAGARRARSTRASRATRRPATPTTACRWIPTATRSCAASRRRWPSAHRAPEEIGYVNYHGTSTQLNDAIESRCVRRVFGRHADRVPGSSTKSMIGHPQGASGAAGVAATALALTRGVLPPTINLDDPDPGLRHGLHSRTPPRRADIDAALCNCLGFGSKNSALVLGRVRYESPEPDDRRRRARRRRRPGRRAGGAVLARRGVRVRLFDRARFPRQAVRRHAESRGAVDSRSPGARYGRALARAADHRDDRDRPGRPGAGDYPDGLAGCHCRGAVSISCCSMPLLPRAPAWTPALRSVSP